VFKFGTAPGTTLGNAAAVDLYVSSGAPCIVPAMPAGHGLATVKGRLLAAGCTPGTVTYRHSSRRKRGRVIALSQPKGTRLAPRTVVAIVVSRGR
jgi:beta-lactam-binding protein with PASTA domain